MFNYVFRVIKKSPFLTKKSALQPRGKAQEKNHLHFVEKIKKKSKKSFKKSKKKSKIKKISYTFFSSAFRLGFRSPSPPFGAAPAPSDTAVFLVTFQALMHFSHSACRCFQVGTLRVNYTQNTYKKNFV